MPPKIRTRSPGDHQSTGPANKKVPATNNNNNNNQQPKQQQQQQQNQQQQAKQQPASKVQQQQQKQNQQQAKPKQQEASAPSTTATKPVISTTKTAPAVAPVAAAAATSPEEQWLQIIIGSYHNAVQGYTFRLQRKLFLDNVHKDKAAFAGEHAVVPPTCLLKYPVLRFSGNQHTGCVYAVTGNGSSLVASSGSDERIALCSVKNHGTVATDLGSMLPASTVRVLSFISSGGGHLICGCDDGSLAVYRTRSWECEAVLQVHQKAILSFAMTKNGALCITLGQDRYLAFVDLMRGNVLHRHKFGAAIARGKQQPPGTEGAAGNKEGDQQSENSAASFRFGFVNQPPTQVVLSPSGKTVAVVAPYYVSFFDLRSAQLLCTLEQENPQPDFEHQAAAFMKTDDNTWDLILATESGKLLACSEPIISSTPSPASADSGMVELAEEAKWLKVNEFNSTSEQVRAAQIQQQKQSMYQIATNRIRSISSMGAQSEGFVTASSSGEIRCWIGERQTKTKSDVMDLYECAFPIQVGGRTTCVSSTLI